MPTIMLSIRVPEFAVLSFPLVLSILCHIRASGTVCGQKVCSKCDRLSLSASFPLTSLLRADLLLTRITKKMRESSIILFSALALSSTCANAQGSWGRRIYYNDNSCSTTIGYQEHVFLPQAPCALSTSPPINTVCENKSTNARVPSSEGTGCDNVPTNKDVSDAPYFPPAGQRNKIEGANYLTVNLYNAASCGVGKGDVSITQIMYAADGKCHVMEPGMYFKASCNSAAGVVEWCE